MRNLTFALLAASTALIAMPAQAVEIADGTATISGLFTPTVDTSSNPNTFTPGPGPIFFGGNNSFVVAATGGFASANGQLGNFNGTLEFSANEGTTRAQTLANFFVFNKLGGGTFNFSVASVLTQSYTVSAATSSIALYLLGTTVTPGLDATPTSLTLTFNRTAASDYSASATLAVPPVPVTGDVPEPASWAMMMAGFGLMGFGLRSQRRKVAVRFG